MSRLTIEAFANNELRFTLSNYSGVSRNMGKQYSHTEIEGWQESLELPHLSQKMIDQYRELHPDKLLLPSFTRTPPTGGGIDTGLDIIRKSQDNHPHREWGRVQRAKKFGSNARHKILESGAALEREIDKRGCRFLTLTLPTNNPENYQYLANWSGYLINLVSQSVRDFRKVFKIKSQIYYVFVWEFQVRGALHLHLLLGCEDLGIVNDVAQTVYDTWFRGLEHIEQKAGCDLFGRWRDRPDIWAKGNKIEKIKKSVARYISKYCSKSADPNSQKSKKKRKALLNPPRIYYPSRFWGSSRNLKNLAKSWYSKVVFSDLPQSSYDYLISIFDLILPKSILFRDYFYSKDHVFSAGLIFYFDDHDWLDHLHAAISILIADLHCDALDIERYRNNCIDKDLITQSNIKYLLKQLEVYDSDFDGFDSDYSANPRMPFLISYDEHDRRIQTKEMLRESV